MPAPVKPSDFCSAVPSATSSLCDRIQAVFLRVPRLLCDFFTWMLNEDGTLTDTFIREVAAIPVGMIMPRAASAVPPGWLLCNGSEISRTGLYASLYAVIGTAWGNGNGTTTFNVPNLQRRTVFGYDPSDANLQVGATGGEEQHTLTVGEMPAHVHRITAFGTNTPSNGNGCIAGNNDQTGPFVYDDTTFPAQQLSIESKGGDQSHENRMPFGACAWMIKY